MYIVFFIAISIAAQPKDAVIFGVSGQDGVYLTNFLLEKGYRVYGITRSIARALDNNISYILQNPRATIAFSLQEGDVTNSNFVKDIINSIQPDEVYNLAAQSSVANSFDSPEYTAFTNALGTLHILAAIKQYSKKTRFFNASSAEMFGKTSIIPQNESTPFNPRSPYGTAKVIFSVYN